MSIQYQYLSPGTYLREDDLSARLTLVTGTSGGAVYEALRGPLDLTFYSTGRAFIDRNGKADPSISFGHDCILAFMEESSNFWGKRVVNGALYAGTTYFIDRYSKNAPAAVGGVRPGRVLHRDRLLGRESNYQAGAEGFFTLGFSGDLITGNTFAMDITDGETLHSVSVPFDTSHTKTMQNIAAAISTAISSYDNGSAAEVQVYQEQSSALQPYLITIRLPLSLTLLFNTPSVTGGASQKTATVDVATRLFDVLAENPGAWANNVGIKITNVDVGTRQRFRLTFSGPIASDGSFQCVVNGRTIGPVPFHTDSDQTMADIATALAADPDIATAAVQLVPGARDNDRNIDIVAEPAAPGAVAISGASAGGASPPSVLVRETLRGVAPTGEFTVEEYELPNAVIPVNKYTVSLQKRVNGQGQQTMIDQAINVTTGRSNRIRVIVPDNNRAYALKPELYAGSYVIDKTVNFLAGGDDGVAVLNSQISAGWQAYRNRERVPVTLLINCGYTDPGVQQTMVALAEYRYDAFAILDMPSDRQGAQDAYNYRMLEMNIDSSFGAIYTPDLLIEDDDSDEQRFIPPSGHVAAVYARSDRDAGVWFAPAGLKRGKLSKIRGLRVDYELGDRELLTPNGVNCIIDKIGAGPTIWGEETLQQVKSVLSSVHARRLLNKIKVAYADGLDYTALFDPNNTYTRYKARQVGVKMLQPLKDVEAVYNYEIVDDERVNTNDVVEDEMMKIDLYIDIVRTAKRILLTSILTPKGANFAELIAVRGTSSTSNATASASA